MTPPDTRQEARPRSLKLAVKLQMLNTSGPVEQRFNQLAAAGLDGVEIGVDDATPIAQLAAASTRTGLAIPTLIAGGTFRDSITSESSAAGRRAVDSVLKAIDAAVSTGSDVVMLNPGWRDGGRTTDEVAAIARARLAPAVDRATEAGVRLAVENLWNGWLQTGAELAAFVDTFPNGTVRVLFDSGNAARYDLPEHWVAELGTRIVRVDVKDYRRAWESRPATDYGDDGQLRAAWGNDGPWGALDALPFQGDVHWELLARAFREAGYEGWCCAEHGVGDRAWIATLVSALRRFNTLYERGTTLGIE